MKIAIDFDGTLVSSTEIFVKLFHETFPDRHLPSWRSISKWDLSETFDVSQAEIEEIFHRVREERHYKYGAPTDTNFFYWLEKLREEGHELYVLTANPEYAHDVITSWLAKYEIDWMPVKHVTNLEEKKEFDFDVMVDDAFAVYKMIDWENNPKNQHLILYSNPWNIGIPKKNNITRALNWQNVYEDIQKLNETLTVSAE